jgi:hypothetical protein
MFFIERCSDRGLCFNCLSDMNGVDALEFLKMVFFISNLKPEDTY